MGRCGCLYWPDHRHLGRLDHCSERHPDAVNHVPPLTLYCLGGPLSLFRRSLVLTSELHDPLSCHPRLCRQLNAYRGDHYAPCYPALGHDCCVAMSASSDQICLHDLGDYGHARLGLTHSRRPRHSCLMAPAMHCPGDLAYLLGLVILLQELEHPSCYSASVVVGYHENWSVHLQDLLSVTFVACC